jgi:putative endonuclease
MTRAGSRGRGDLGEDRACAHLVSAGYEILDRGWATRSGELDIVARAPDGVLAFVEVKTAYGDGAGDPGAWVTPTKAGRIARTATAWLVAHDALDTAARFDLVAVRPDGSVEHLPDAFHPPA